MILFEIKVFGRNIKETTVARYLIKVTAHPSFEQLRVIRRVHRVIWRISYKDSVVSPPYLNLLGYSNRRYSQKITPGREKVQTMKKPIRILKKNSEH